MNLGFQVQTKIQKPLEEVFNDVHDPDKLSSYFTTGGASAPLHEATTVQWAFADNPGDEKKSFPVRVEKVIPNELIVLGWEGAEGLETSVRFDFEQTGPDETLVKIAESGWRENQDDLDRSYMNCYGWAQMLMCLKAFAEHGINLRKGAYTGLFPSDENAETASAGE